MSEPKLNTYDYRNAPSGVGPLADDWKDKPHRLIYDLCAEIDKLRAPNYKSEIPFRCHIGFHPWPKWSDRERRILSSFNLIHGDFFGPAEIQHRTCPGCNRFQWRQL